jgi:hypothetical protein
MTGSVTFTDAAELWDVGAIIEASTPEAEDSSAHRRWYKELRAETWVNALARV